MCRHKYDRNIEDSVDLLGCLDAGDATPKVDIHKHQVREMRGSLLKRIRSREGRAHHTMAQHLQPLFEVKGHQCFIFDYKNLRLFHKYLNAPRTAKNTPLARTREDS